MPAGGCRNRNNAASGAERFVERLGMFMTLVGLSALIVGGAGISNAVSAFVNRRSESIATLKCLGASSRDVFGIYLTEIILLSLLAIAVGLAAGAVAPFVVGALFGSILPLPITARVEFVPLAIAGTLGFLVALAFTLWPLSQNPAGSGFGPVPPSQHQHGRLAGMEDAGGDDTAAGGHGGNRVPGVR